MNARPVNHEQLEAEVVGLTGLSPGWMLVFSPADWLRMVNGMRFAGRCPELSEAEREQFRRVARVVQAQFPKDCAEIQQLFRLLDEADQGLGNND